jgi:hypothetical protein
MVLAAVLCFRSNPSNSEALPSLADIAPVGVTTTE